MTPSPIRSDRGFSLIEAVASLTIVLIIASAIFSGLAQFAEIGQSQQMQMDMHSGMRGSSEMLTQEIGQAGALNYAGTTLSAAVTVNASAQSVAVGSTANIYDLEQLLVDTGSSQETVTVTAVTATSLSAIFTKSHSSGAPVTALGVFPSGVLTTTSTASRLDLFGDINGDGTIVYVRYTCDTVGGTLSRSSTPITLSTLNTTQVLLQGLVANPGGTACFQYTTTTVGSYTLVTNVAVTLTVETSETDPQTGSYITQTKTFNNLVPRNLLAGVDLANSSLTTLLQTTPAGVTTLSGL